MRTDASVTQLGLDIHRKFSKVTGSRTLIAGQPGDRFTLEVDFHGGVRHLPIVSLKRAA